VRTLGGYRVQGRTAEAARAILEDARALDGAGAFSIVLEGIPAELGREITAAVGAPTIGIGAGPHCDGQILVLHDLLGLSGDFAPKFVRRYADLGAAVGKAAADYRRDVEEGRFPCESESY
jgi:3-methyl-2-oxobutanoate hydroxymethyltransferase